MQLDGGRRWIADAHPGLHGSVISPGRAAHDYSGNTGGKQLRVDTAAETVRADEWIDITAADTTLLLEIPNLEPATAAEHHDVIRRKVRSSHDACDRRLDSHGQRDSLAVGSEGVH